MKRILSVILSLALLASALIIPMSVSAEGTLTAEEAYNQLNAAVDGLELDLDNIHPLQIANPDRSITAQGNYAESGTVSSVSDVSDESLTSILGSKYVKISANNTTTGNSNGLIPGHVHAVEYPVTSDANRIFARDIGYIVLYVNTNRSFKMSLGVHDNATGTPNIINGDKAVSVSAADDKYQAVAFNLTSVDWVNGNGVYIYNNYNHGFYAKSMYLSTGGIKWYFPSIQEMTDGQGDIAASDDIHFGSIFYVPVDTNVRNFKFNYDLDKQTISQRFDSLSPQMIAAAEMITNDDGRYTAESFATLQEAIKNAKATLINDETSGDDNALALFKAEVANLYKLEEVFRPKFVGSNTAREKATDEDVKNLSDYQKSLLGEHYIKIEDSDLGKEINFVDVSATAQYPDSPVKDYTKYRDIYLYVVNNTGSVYYVPTFNAYIGGDSKSDISFYDKNLYVNSRWNSFKLNTTVNRCDLFDLTVVNRGNPYDKYDVRYFVNNYTFDNGDGTITTYYEKYKGSSRIQWTIPNGDLSDTSNLILGSILGEVAFNTSTIDTDVTDKASLVNFYTANIANKGYENSAAVEETMELLGITTVPVVKELINTIGIKYPENTKYTLETAVVDEKVSFSLDTSSLQSGVTVTVKYGDGIVTPDENGVYTITVAKGKELHIIPSHVTTTFMNADSSNYTADINTSLNLAKGITPYIFVTNGTPKTRTQNTGSPTEFSDGYTTQPTSEPNLGFKFLNDNKTFINGYDPSAKFDFTKSASDYDAFVDVIYDLGCVADINKIQHFGHNDAGLTLGAYSVYASTDVNNLFNRNESLVVDYQNKDVANSQQHVFPARSARFVAFRIYCPVTTSNWAGASNQLRIWELAIYGTQTGAYKVTEIQAPTDNNSGYIEKNSLLNSDTLMSIKGYENDDEIGNITIDKNNAHQQKLHSGTYQKGGHGDFITTAVFYDNDNSKFKNGFIINREDTTGNIEFRTQGAKTTIHSDFTYDLGSYYKIDRFELYSSTDLYNKLLTQSYEVYIGNDLATLYEGTPVAVYNNYYNNFAQSIKFKESQIGKYLGVRILMAADRTDTANYVRLDELAAYGTEVGAPDEGSKLAPEIITSKSGYIYNKGGSSVYPGTDGSERTALRLTVGYKSPKVPGGANARKIVLANGKTANVIERNVIAIAKSKYNSDQDFNIHTEGASVTTSTATSTKHPVSNYFKSEAIKDDNDYCMAYGALNINNISKDNASKEVVVRGRVVYEYDGQIYAVYSDIVGVNETVSAQAAYANLNKPDQGWFK